MRAELSEVMPLARNIVNQVLDESGADVPTRQRINDCCDKFVARLLSDRLTQHEAEVRERVAGEIEAEYHWSRVGVWCARIARGGAR